jgi:RNA polymerase sigma-70 factor (ECF subfamily)
MSHKDGGKGLQLFQLLQRNRLLIARLLRRFTFKADELEDVMQETILRALEAQRKGEIHHPRQFMISIAKNVAREELRKRARAATNLIEDCDLENHQSMEPGADAVLEGREKLRVFATAVAHLPPQCRRVFVLKYVSGASHKEIASRLGISVSTVEKHVAAGLKACREKMSAALDGESAGGEIAYLFTGKPKLKQR